MDTELNNHVSHWNGELGLLWTRYLPPCRPSWSEMVIYTKYLRQRQQKSPKRPIKLLILGSTTEFRDWAHQENIEATILDCSADYNKAISWELKHKFASEKLMVGFWQDMSFSQEFDLIVGDLIIGNLSKEEIPPFLKKVADALKVGGFFMTKSFFSNEHWKYKSLEEIFYDYCKKGITYSPYSSLVYDIAMNCVDKESNILNFNFMFRQIEGLYHSGIIKKETFESFKNLGWQDSMKIIFYMPPFSLWEKWISESLKISKKEYGKDLYSKNFPIYITTTKEKMNT
jgi:hypothetical protein